VDAIRLTCSRLLEATAVDRVHEGQGREIKEKEQILIALGRDFKKEGTSRNEGIIIATLTAAPTTDFSSNSISF
jgi:hypothetical protein